MKQFEISIHTFFFKDGLSRLFVHKNKKIKQGSPINFYMFKFNNAEYRFNDFGQNLVV